MQSALKHWGDVLFKNTLMFLVSEEYPFYLPNAQEDVKAFVVLTIRNSPIETLHSKPIAGGLKQSLSEDLIKKITFKSIEYFNQFNLAELYNGDEMDKKDVYGDLSIKYAVAWNALTHLSNEKEYNVCFIPSVRAGAENFLVGIEKDCENKQGFNFVVKDGFDKSIDADLARQLTFCKTEGEVFYVDCFKMVSRHPELLFCVLEYLLVNNLTFVSCNYYITNGYAEKRRKVLKAAHNKKEFIYHLSFVESVSSMHAQILTNLRRQLQ